MHPVSHCLARTHACLISARRCSFPPDPRRGAGSAPASHHTLLLFLMLESFVRKVREYGIAQPRVPSITTQSSLFSLRYAALPMHSRKPLLRHLSQISTNLPSTFSVPTPLLSRSPPITSRAPSFSIVLDQLIVPIPVQGGVGYKLNALVEDEAEGKG